MHRIVAGSRVDADLMALNEGWQPTKDGQWISSENEPVIFVRDVSMLQTLSEDTVIYLVSGWTDCEDAIVAMVNRQRERGLRVIKMGV